MKNTKTNFIISFFLIALSLTTIFDFLIDSQIKQSNNFKINKVKQKYYNASQNYHFTYEIVTPTETFNVSEEFAKSISDTNEIYYGISKIYNEINWYSSDLKNKSTYSLRYFSGLIIPLIFIIYFILSLVFKFENFAINNILRILVIGNVIYLLIN